MCHRHLLFVHLFCLFNIYPLGSITAVFTDLCKLCFLGTILNSGWVCEVKELCMVAVPSPTTTSPHS